MTTHAADPYPPPGAAVPGAPPPLVRSGCAASTSTASHDDHRTVRIHPAWVVLAGGAVALAAAGYWLRRRRLA